MSNFHEVLSESNWDWVASWEKSEDAWFNLDEDQLWSLAWATMAASHRYITPAKLTHKPLSNGKSLVTATWTSLSTPLSDASIWQGSGTYAAWYKHSRDWLPQSKSQGKVGLWQGPETAW